MVNMVFYKCYYKYEGTIQDKDKSKDVFGTILVDECLSLKGKGSGAEGVLKDYEYLDIIVESLNDYEKV